MASSRKIATSGRWKMPSVKRLKVEHSFAAKSWTGLRSIALTTLTTFFDL